MKFRIERMAESEYRNLKIDYGFYSTPVGEILVASTSRGICCIELADNRDEALQLLCKSSEETVLHLYGTDFQIDVWGALLDIPFGKTSTYSEIAMAINNPRALRAVGTAIGRNPVAILVPCHRVLRTDGGIGGYYWGIEKKKKLLEWERCV